MMSSANTTGSLCIEMALWPAACRKAQLLRMRINVLLGI